MVIASILYEVQVGAEMNVSGVQKLSVPTIYRQEDEGNYILRYCYCFASLHKVLYGFVRMLSLIHI